jgi:hypothetical protein
VFAAATVWATTILARASFAPAVEQHKALPQSLRMVTLVVGIAAGIQAWASVGDVLSLRRSRAHRQTNDFLLTRLVKLCREGHFAGCDTTKVSLHVWEVPAWYRRLVPYKLRRRLRERFADDTGAWRPKLVLAGHQRFEPQESLSLRHRKGTGLVGTCLSINRPDQIEIVDFESPDFQAALQSEETWRKNTSAAITRGLSYRRATQLAARYGQAAALVVREPNSEEAIACVTLEVPPGCSRKLEDSPEVLRELEGIADALADFLSIRLA